MICTATTHLSEVFSTIHGCVSQCDYKRRLVLSFGGGDLTLSFQELSDLKKRLDLFDIEDMLLNPRHPDIEIILLKDNCLILSTLQIIVLKELLQGAFVMFRLNHMISDCLHRLVSC